MLGDSFGSPRRDDRHNPRGAESEPPQGAAHPLAEHPEDRKVAGAAFTGPSGSGDSRSGDTAGLPPVGGGGPAPLVVVDPLAGPPAKGARSGRAGLKIAAVAAGVAVVVGGGSVAAFALTGDSKPQAAPGAKPSDAQPLADAAAPVDPMLEQQMRRKAAFERASRAIRGSSGKNPKLLPKGEPIPTEKPKSASKGDKDNGGGGAGPDPMPAGEAQQVAKAMLPSYGMGGSGQFACLVKLWNKESGWRVTAQNPSSGAYGIPQALPGTKMASAGSDWRTNARTQIKWGLGYIKNRYKTPCGAWSHSQRVGWY
ncbi:lytic transglycosylase domain-containing protein [Actinomadura kijaniata]|uniref:aggregation-promoting factor C-terminal-like domain-containing protein n=1 Tax=Actinomadura kijaniata TaxID=46161 RepID=UPI000ABDBF9D|nr:lytic transglycosylase domain-containing protein [Actinomadura kijaniata]